MHNNIERDDPLGRSLRKFLKQIYQNLHAEKLKNLKSTLQEKFFSNSFGFCIFM
jgi:hypothetical protein